MTGYFDCFCHAPHCVCQETKVQTSPFNSSGLRYGHACTYDSSCRYSNCHRISKTCICYNEYHREGDLCVGGSLGYPCATGCSFYAFCDQAIGYKCRCGDNFYKLPNNSIKCFLKLTVGHKCLVKEACGARSYCKNGYCDCNYKEQYHEGGWCHSKKELGGDCLKNDECINNVCSDNKCVCPYGFEEILGLCTRNLFNLTCRTDNDCLEKMNYTMCNIQKKLCACNLKTYHKNGTCIPKKRIGEICTENVECSYDYCKDSICNCRYGYYLFGDECTEGKKAGAECYSDEECQALNNHSSCVYRFCQCSPMFHLEKKKYCVPIVGISTSCTFKARIDMSKILDTAKYLSISWYQISKDFEQKARDIYQTKLSETFVSISAFPGEYNAIVEALIYFKIVIDDISMNLSEILVDQLQFFEPIPFLPEMYDIKINALEGICMNIKPLISYEVKIGLIIATCLLLASVFVVIGTIWHRKSNSACDIESVNA